jgi:hypothetical protein
MESAVGLLNRVPVPPSVRLETFLSHSWGNERRAEIHALIGKEWQHRFDYQDHSITSAHPIHESNSRLLLQEIARIIARCDVFLVPTGMEGAYSGWMDREIFAACSIGVPIIAITLNGAQREWALAKEFANEVVGWRGSSIRDAILRWTSEPRRSAFIAKLQRRQEFERQRRFALAVRPLIGPPTTQNVLSNGLAPRSPAMPLAILRGMGKRRD